MHFPDEVSLRLAERLLRLPHPDEGGPVGRAGPELVSRLDHVGPEVLQVGQPRVLEGTASPSHSLLVVSHCF